LLFIKITQLLKTTYCQLLVCIKRPPFAKCNAPGGVYYDFYGIFALIKLKGSNITPYYLP